MYKRGISLISMIIYVVLFFAFSAFAVSAGSNMNYQALNQKGVAYLNEQIQKLQYNMLFSAKDSLSIDNISGKIVFSNNDEYSYSVSDKAIYKNGGKLISDVEDFKIIDVSLLTNVPSFFLMNIDENVSNICIEIKLKKYGSEVSKQLFFVAGDGVNV